MLEKFNDYWSVVNGIMCIAARGGQKTVESDPPDQSGRPARPPVRPFAYIQTDTNMDILNIRITEG